jgi:hypothetical protein
MDMNEYSNPEKKVQRCAFCGKDGESANRLISGAFAYICGDCVQLCNQIIAEDSWREENKGSASSLRHYEMKHVLAWLKKRKLRVTLAHA